MNRLNRFRFALLPNEGAGSDAPGVGSGAPTAPAAPAAVSTPVATAPVPAPVATAPVPAVSAPAAVGEDVTGLKNTIATLRSELATTQTALKAYEGIDPTAAKTALAELPQLKTQIEAATLDQGVNAATDGALPHYRELIAAAARQLVVVGADGKAQSADGRAIADLQNDLKAKYPFAFAADSVPAGSGTTASNGSAPASPAVVQMQNGFIPAGTDPDAVLKGEVKIQ